MKFKTYFFNREREILRCRSRVVVVVVELLGRRSQFSSIDTCVKTDEAIGFGDIPENTHSLHKGKYHCTTDLLFDWFEFDQNCKSVSIST